MTNFVIVESPDPVKLLLEAVPKFRNQLDDEDLDLSYVVFGALAQYVGNLEPNDPILARTIAFLNDLADRGDSSLDNLIQVGFFEGFADDPRSLPLIAEQLGARASELLAAALGSVKFDPEALTPRQK